MTENKVKEQEFRGLHTMIPKDVFDELQAMAMDRKTFTGVWDYGTLFRELIYVYKTQSLIYQRIESLESMLRDIIQHDIQDNINITGPKKFEIKLLGKNAIKLMEKEEEKDNEKEKRKIENGTNTG